MNAAEYRLRQAITAPAPFRSTPARLTAADYATPDIQALIAATRAHRLAPSHATHSACLHAAVAVSWMFGTPSNAPSWAEIRIARRLHRKVNR